MYMSQTYIIPEVIYVLEEGSVTKTKIRNVTIQFSDHLHVCRRLLPRSIRDMVAMSSVSGCESSTTWLSGSLSAVATAETPAAFTSSNMFTATAETAASVETPALETPAVETVTSVETPSASSTAAHAVKAHQYCVQYKGTLPSGGMGGRSCWMESGLRVSTSLLSLYQGRSLAFPGKGREVTSHIGGLL